MSPVAPRPLCLLFLGFLALLASARAAAIERAFDAARSSADFSVRVLWLHQVTGHIGDVDGVLRIEPGQRAVVEASIDVARVHMDDPRYLDTIRSSDFFDSADFPRMAFRSAPFEPVLLARGGRLAGWLTLRGVTRPVEFQLLPDACAAPATGPCSIRVRGAVRRSEFGMRSHRFSVADMVQMRLSITLAEIPGP